MHSTVGRSSSSRVPLDDSLAVATASRALCIYQDTDENETSSSESTDEIPVWVRGEQRWISGVTDHTTAADLVEALIQDEGISDRAKDYVITERWRRVEQILDGRTKILKIWSAWGEAQAEVKLTLRRVERHRRRSPSVENCDSGRGSPTGSAIVRRRRHRAAKSSAAWITHAQTPHPRTQRATIERLMKLILEQGETIQQQLSRLRERELEIAFIEEERHRVREREHGKNYLLETYLNGLHEADDKEVTTGNSDSGVHTEDTTSPVAGISPTLEDDQDDCPKLEEACGTVRRKSRSNRETMLLRDHETAKEFSEAAEKSKGAQPSKESNEGQIPDDMATEIDLLEKMYILNKHLQREEELLVRLSAKVKRYESENPSLSEHQIIEALERVNEEITQRNNEIEDTDRELEKSISVLKEKSQELQELHEQLDAAEVETLMLEDKAHEVNVTPEKNLNLSREYLAENIYNISKIILKNSVKEDVGSYIRHTPDSEVLRQPILPTPVEIPPHSPMQFTTEVQVHQSATSPLPPQLPPPQFIDFTTLDLIASVNMMHHCNQRNINSNARIAKITHKKLIGTEADSNSDTGLSSLGEDMTQLGTLV
ncbi:ras association domain-containing protein 10 isoform X2 [Phlebotomus papatasi]|uniref:ras association domain-containing protein 10 isoform X2 n=1 Tax=Phlebotomus papatasi TaxID=29031 RepID=UPI0024836BF9|nr:ras association domain-containing protein 10 isoform X2 [Phlebotomus papatasi]